MWATVRDADYRWGGAQVTGGYQVGGGRGEGEGEWCQHVPSVCTSSSKPLCSHETQ